ncbi:hypothetical protein ACQP0C_39945 [Nocardia sp. CA-129566]|uniref:hypothetical protein n=1 Tax=Nocardia sp. CA-129566 TaxID=3239976 RepID=UPI003D97B210
MPDDEDAALIEIHVIQDVIDAVETLLRQTERSGRQLTAPRSRIYATVLYAVLASAREQPFRPTLDAADLLDSILDGAESPHPDNTLAELIETHIAKAN